MTLRSRNKKVYRAYLKMVARCHDPEDFRYAWYGGRTPPVSVCERWRGPGGFERFFEDLGPPPSAKHTLGRKEPDDHYEPGRVEWQTWRDQGRSRRSSKILTFGGKSQCASAWAEEAGISRKCLWKRMKLGWPLDRALTETPGNKAA